MVIKHLREFDPGIKLIDRGTGFESHYIGGGAYSNTYKILTRISPKKVKEICIQLEMPGAIQEGKEPYLDFQRRLADIDVHSLGLLRWKKLSRKGNDSLTEFYR